MSPVPVSPRRVFGVDFSAAMDAGDHIWLCRAHPGRAGIRIESVDPISELPGGAAGRAEALAALVTKVVESPRSAWGFDFCFALPAPILDAVAPGATGYAAQLDVVASFGDADGCRDRCAAIGSAGELRRPTDDDAETPFSPYNLRIYKQTFHGMVDVLRPLRSRPEVAVLPFDRLPGNESGERLAFNRAAGSRVPHVYLMEVRPVSVLGTLDGVPRRYKSSGEEGEQQRLQIYRRLVELGLIRPVARALRTRIVEPADGDAIDAVLAAVGAWRGYRDHDHEEIRRNPRFAREGFVYR